MSTKLRPKVPCDCKKCNGKLVDTRTRKKHYEEEKQFQSSMKKGKEKEASSSIHASTSGNRSRSDSVDSSHSSRDRYDDDVIMNDSDHARSDEEFLSPKPVSRRKGEDMINFIRPKIILSFQVKNPSNILIHPVMKKVL